MMDSTELLNHDRIQAEIAKLMAETERLNDERDKTRLELLRMADEREKMGAEYYKLLMEAQKLHAESLKFSRETFWYPIAVSGAFAAALLATYKFIAA